MPLDKVSRSLSLLCILLLSPERTMWDPNKEYRVLTQTSRSIHRIQLRVKRLFSVASLG
jgi:hypothetical protein